MLRLSRDQKLGAMLLVFAVLALIFWVPIDIDTGIVEKVRRRIAIGDALAPVFALCILGASALAMLLNRTTKQDQSINWRFLLTISISFGLVLSVMRYLGPVVSDLFNDESYRALRDTAPWKYIGFITGSTALITILSSLAERSFNVRRLWIALIISVVLALIYDLPFKTLLLPPNSDY